MEQALYKAAILTFEELGFVFPVERLPEEGESYEKVKVSVRFSGAFSGEMVLQVEPEVLPTLASNMLGMFEEVEEEIQYDVLGELANVICGNALPSIAGKQEIFHLEAPEIMTNASEKRVPKAAAYLDLEEGKADVLLYLN